MKLSMLTISSMFYLFVYMQKVTDTTMVSCVLAECGQILSFVIIFGLCLIVWCIIAFFSDWSIQCVVVPIIDYFCQRLIN